MEDVFSISIIQYRHPYFQSAKFHKARTKKWVCLKDRQTQINILRSLSFLDIDNRKKNTRKSVKTSKHVNVLIFSPFSYLRLFIITIHKKFLN